MQSAAGSNDARVETVRDFYLAILGIRHATVKGHCERVGMLARMAAESLGKDVRAAGLAGVFHDIGKMLQPSDLFSGRDITDEEYAAVKEHALLGFAALKDTMLFTALCAGLHHAMGKSGGYGLTVADFPAHLSPCTAKKVLDIATIVSVADFVDAFLTRKTTPKDGSTGKPLSELLAERFPDDEAVRKAVLQAAVECGSYAFCLKWE